MAARKKKKKIVRKATKKVTRKAKVLVKAKPKKKARKLKPSNAARGKTKARKAARKPSREYGEGNYKASQRFRKSEEAFVKANKTKIPALGKAAEAALDGPEGGALRAAEAEAAGHAAGKR